ncbi:hypothetical protein [Gracilibacillus salinarum]|uniref:Uncharacterized protein n=1 Tax=Gracilibacillus salinarum TaxID=2932255 RepID=A0ABY4GP81_9BACI|nr:hypothetical protein [Gracilibacillus salinarum]UOQ86198.1 hypothetical protein MUN87_04685 [Gracilibacillus salinarum]
MESVRLKRNKINLQRGNLTMTKRLFMLENVGNNEQHSVANIDDKQADALIQSGKATETSFGRYDEFRTEAQRLHNSYRKSRDKINDSDNPLHTDEYKKYELDKLYAEYEANATALQSEWNDLRAQMVEDAYKKSATAKVHVTTSDKEQAEQIANRFALKVKSAPNVTEFASIVKEAERTIGYQSDEVKTALQGQLNGLVDDINAKAEKYETTALNAKGLLSSVQKVDNLDLLASKLADQLPMGVTTEFRTYKNVRSRAHKV